MGKAIKKQNNKKNKGMIDGIDSEYQWKRSDSQWKKNAKGWKAE